VLLLVVVGLCGVAVVCVCWWLLWVVAGGGGGVRVDVCVWWCVVLPCVCAGCGGVVAVGVAVVVGCVVVVVVVVWRWCGGWVSWLRLLLLVVVLCV